MDTHMYYYTCTIEEPRNATCTSSLPLYPEAASSSKLTSVERLSTIKAVNDLAGALKKAVEK